MPRHLRTVAVLATGALFGNSLGAQQPVALSVVLTAFLADSGVPTRGLPWTTGQQLPIQWESSLPVKLAYQHPQGFTHHRTGKLRLAGAGKTSLIATIEVEGIAAGIARTAVYFSLGEWPLEAAEKALIADGLKLSALKCSREKEGASYGNLVYVVKAPGKTASALGANWDCAQSGCNGGFTILYRRADVTTIECASA